MEILDVSSEDRNGLVHVALAGELDLSTVAKVQEELRRVEANAPATLVVDLSMPRLDGIGLIRKIRAHGSELPVVAMMGVAPSEQVRELEELGVRHLLQKPFGLDDLLKLLAPMFADA